VLTEIRVAVHDVQIRVFLTRHSAIAEMRQLATHAAWFQRPIFYLHAAQGLMAPVYHGTHMRCQETPPFQVLLFLRIRFYTRQPCTSAIDP
jgi:hypothetical protein